MQEILSLPAVAAEQEEEEAIPKPRAPALAHAAANSLQAVVAVPLRIVCITQTRAVSPIPWTGMEEEEDNPLAAAQWAVQAPPLPAPRLTAVLLVHKWMTSLDYPVSVTHLTMPHRYPGLWVRTLPVLLRAVSLVHLLLLEEEEEEDDVLLLHHRLPRLLIHQLMAEATPTMAMEIINNSNNHNNNLRLDALRLLLLRALPPPLLVREP